MRKLLFFTGVITNTISATFATTNLLVLELAGWNQAVHIAFLVANLALLVVLYNILEE